MPRLTTPAISRSKSPTHVALVTSRELPDLDPDDRLLRDALVARGVRAVAVAWDDATYDWSRPRACVIRSTWDYPPRRDEFVAWAERVEAKTLLLNDARTVRWNTHKRYLRDLEARGVRIVPTVWLTGEISPAELGRLLEDRGWPLAVVKPAISGGARHTIRVTSEPASLAAASSLVTTIVAQGEAMVQPYLASVDDHGERSVVFIEAEISHAIRKFPALVETRVPHGQERAVDVADDEADFARRVLAAAAMEQRTPLYARVDIARAAGGEPVLMELELVEPSLFLGTAKAGGAAARLADAIVAHL